MTIEQNRTEQKLDRVNQLICERDYFKSNQTSRQRKETNTKLALKAQNIPDEL